MLVRQLISSWGPSWGLLRPALLGLPAAPCRRPRPSWGLLGASPDVEDQRVAVADALAPRPPDDCPLGAGRPFSRRFLRVRSTTQSIDEPIHQSIHPSIHQSTYLPVVLRSTHIIHTSACVYCIACCCLITIKQTSNRYIHLCYTSHIT